MRVEYRRWDNPTKRYAGKIILRPETPEELADLDSFRAHVGSPQRGRKFEIIFKRRVVVGPEQMTAVLQQRLQDPAASPPDASKGTDHAS
jgi:hypothetical protein